MELVECTHYEMNTLGGGIEKGTCARCGQVVQYRGVGKPVLTKLGRIDGKVVVPGAGKILKLNAQDRRDLEAARKTTALSPKEQGGDENHKGALESVSSTTVSGDGETAAMIPMSRRKERFKYLNDNKEAINRDYHSLTLKEFFDTWKLSSATWTKLKKEWGVEGKQSHQKKRAFKQQRTEQPSSGVVQPGALEHRGKDLPSFPEWAPEKWGLEVAIQWLLTYEELKRIEERREVREQQLKGRAKKENWLSRLFHRGSLLGT